MATSNISPIFLHQGPNAIHLKIGSWKPSAAASRSTGEHYTAADGASLSPMASPLPLELGLRPFEKLMPRSIWRLDPAGLMRMPSPY